MNVGLYATKIQANALKTREEIESAYDRYPDQTLFWCFIDLVESSNYRIVHGPKKGYIRGETFFTLVDSVIASCPDVRLVKEIGDAVFLCSSDIRNIFECMILIDQTAQQLASVAGTDHYPFAIRAAIGFGVAKRLKRRHEDFIGIPIDQLARIMSIKSETANLFIHEDAYSPAADILPEYSDFLSIGEPKMVPADKSKQMLRPVYYREITIDYVTLFEFKEHFVPWR